MKCTFDKYGCDNEKCIEHYPCIPRSSIIKEYENAEEYKKSIFEYKIEKFEDSIEKIKKLKNPFVSSNMSNQSINCANEWEQLREMFLKSLLY